ncbi:3',5'-cyclic adenosine monophosphate phosphodiesterase CpdA [archaeon HR03]|nr:3',5'-cyclic adenosine monophosphate phosphodiesterase CpdA [archaeon HR03]
MKVLQASDIHGSMAAASALAEKAMNYDIVVLVGDITHFGAVPQAEPILATVAKSGRPVLFVPGNCDHPSLLGWRPPNKNIINIHGAIVRQGGYDFYGLGGGNLSPFNTLIEFSEEEFESMLSKFNPASESFILISHTPPFGVDADIGRGRHLGSTAIRKFVETKRPLAVCCGHIHEGRSISKIGETVVVNAGPAKEGFYASLEILGKEVKAELHSL